MTKSDVEEVLERALLYNGAVRTLMQALEQAGCAAGRDIFRVVACSAAVGGGFAIAPEPQILLCHNRLHTPQEVQNAMAHELIHAYDHCRARGQFDWSDCRQHAHTEIRAANLSGDCSAWQELARGNLPLLPTAWAPQQRACVARRAAISLAFNPGCGGPGGAAAAVAAGMAGGLADTAPFGPGQGVARP